MIKKSKQKLGTIRCSLRSTRTKQDRFMVLRDWTGICCFLVVICGCPLVSLSYWTHQHINTRASVSLTKDPNMYSHNFLGKIKMWKTSTALQFKQTSPTNHRAAGVFCFCFVFFPRCTSSNLRWKEPNKNPPLKVHLLTFRHITQSSSVHVQ